MSIEVDSPITLETLGFYRAPLGVDTTASLSLVGSGFSSEAYKVDGENIVYKIGMSQSADDAWNLRSSMERACSGANLP